MITNSELSRLIASRQIWINLKKDSRYRDEFWEIIKDYETGEIDRDEADDRFIDLMKRYTNRPNRSVRGRKVKSKIS